ncbi:MAG: hypothetical protein JRI68_10295 [Deltaproteobacteria bacterium]|nr:hypothetical protein [Deltaproteobacteria bacterium]
METKAGKWVTSVHRAIGAGVVTLALATAAMAQPSGAAAQPSGDDGAAKQKFTEAMSMMRAKRFSEACLLFERSFELSAKLPTQFRLAECYEQVGRLASAWQNFDQVARDADEAGQAKQRDFARTKADRLDSLVSKIVIMVDPATRDLEGLVIAQDDVPIPPAQWIEPQRVDPGSHRFTAAAPDHEEWVQEVSVEGEGQLVTLEIPALTPTALPPPEPEPVIPEDDGPFITLPTLGIIIGGVGVAALGTGIVLGAVAKSSYDDSLEHCTGDFCSQEGLDQQDDAVTLGTAGTVVFFVGAAAIVGGAALWFFAPDEESSATDEVALHLGVTPSGAVLRGTW